MSATGTQTRTYTSVDIRKVVDTFAAEFSMMAQSTGLRTRENVATVVADLKIFAETSYLSEVTLVLKDKDGAQIRGAKYRPSEAAVGWTSDRPGNSLWPQTTGGTLSVIATLSPAWWSKTGGEKKAFQTSTGLLYPWAPTTEDTTLSALSETGGTRFASNGYGWERTSYSS